jgi:hypothetical protein
MVAIQVFGKEGCAQCLTAKAKFSHYLTKKALDGKVQLLFFDMGTVEGLAEGAYQDVSDIPTTIITDEDNVVARWEKRVPTTEEFEASLSGHLPS